jgi:AcrR family transcriptional regulator
MPGPKASEEQRRKDILQAAFKVAARERLTGCKVSEVAREAGVSKGLVYFYFDNKETLLVASLEWLLKRIILARADEEPAQAETPRARFLAVVRHDIERLPAQRDSVELLFDYWVMGTRHRDIQRMIRGALDRYRETLRPLAQAVIEAEPERYEDVSADGLAAVAAGFIEGCALQTVMDPERFDVEEYLRSLHALITRPK